MTVRNTVDVVWREDRSAWVVEGGNGRTAVLGVCSLHDTRAEAVDAANRLAVEHDAAVRVLNERGEEWPPSDASGGHPRERGDVR